MKKILSLLLAVIMAFSIPCTAFAAEATPEGEIISTFIGEDGYEYEYIQYSEPVTYAYDGSTHTLLATIRRKPSDNNLTKVLNTHLKNVHVSKFARLLWSIII